MDLISRLRRSLKTPEKRAQKNPIIVGLIPMTMETRCFKVIFSNYLEKKTAEDTLVPPLWGKRDKKFVFLVLFVHAAVCGGTCAFTLKFVNMLIKNSSRDDRPSIST